MLKKYICTLAGICFFLPVAAWAIVPTFSYQTMEDFIDTQYEAIKQKAISFSVEGVVMDQAMTWGEEGLGGVGTSDVQTNESSAEGVVYTQGVSSIADPQSGLTTNMLKKSDQTEAAAIIRTKIQIPTEEQRKNMTEKEVKERETAVTRIQNRTTQDGLAVGMANIQISAEQDTRKEAWKKMIADSNDLRGDIQARSQVGLGALGEMNRLLASSAKKLGVMASAALTKAQSEAGEQTQNSDGSVASDESDNKEKAS